KDAEVHDSGVVAHRRGQEPARAVSGEEPELMGRPGHGDVQKVAGLVVLRVARLVDLHEYDVVELQSLDLPDVGHVDAWPEGKVLIGNPTQVRHLGLTKAMMI